MTPFRYLHEDIKPLFFIFYFVFCPDKDPDQHLFLATIFYLTPNLNYITGSPTTPHSIRGTKRKLRLCIKLDTGRTIFGSNAHSSPLDIRSTVSTFKQKTPIYPNAGKVTTGPKILRDI